MTWSDLVYRFTIAPRLKRLRRLLPDATICPAGSRYVCNPPRMFTDIDFLVFIKGDVSEPYLKLRSKGYTETPYTTYFGDKIAGHFTAWRKGPVNLIVTTSRHYALTFHTATYICKQRNVQYKYSRVLIHEGLRGGVAGCDDYEFGKSWAHNDLCDLFKAVNGPHGHAIHMAYRAQHGLEETFT